LTKGEFTLLGFAVGLKAPTAQSASHERDRRPYLRRRKRFVACLLADDPQSAESGIVGGVEGVEGAVGS